MNDGNKHGVSREVYECPTQNRRSWFCDTFPTSLGLYLRLALLEANKKMEDLKARLKENT